MIRITINLAIVFLLSIPTAALAQSDPKSGEDSEEQKVKDPYSVYSTGLFQEVFIDEEFDIYDTRRYQGVVPGRDEAEGIPPQPVDTTAQPKGKTIVDRVGFEQRELFSRVFIVADRAISPWVYDNFVQAQSNPDVPYEVYIELANAQVPKKNDRRPLLTQAFNTPIMSIQAKPIKGGVRVVITLKREARYLPVQVGKVLYIDVER